MQLWCLQRAKDEPAENWKWLGQAERGANSGAASLNKDSSQGRWAWGRTLSVVIQGTNSRPEVKGARLDMVRDLYGRDGRAAHYVDDNNTFYTWIGKPIGFVNGEEIYTSYGRHVGRLSGGWVRDKSGNAVAFTSGASGGPIPPIPAFRRYRQFLRYRP